MNYNKYITFTLLSNDTYTFNCNKYTIKSILESFNKPYKLDTSNLRLMNLLVYEYEYRRRNFIKNGFKVLSLKNFNSIIDTVYFEIKEGNKNGRHQEDYSIYRRAECIRESCRIEQRKRIEKYDK